MYINQVANPGERKVYVDPMFYILLGMIVLVFVDNSSDEDAKNDDCTDW